MAVNIVPLHEYLGRDLKSTLLTLLVTLVAKRRLSTRESMDYSMAIDAMQFLEHKADVDTARVQHAPAAIVPQPRRRARIRDFLPSHNPLEPSNGGDCGWHIVCKTAGMLADLTRDVRYAGHALARTPDRTFVADDAVNGAVVLSEGFWLRRLGGDPAAVGRTITLDGSPHLVVGVVPRDFRFPDA